MSVIRPVVLVALLLLSGMAGGSATVGAQETQVTLTVSVTTPAGDPVGDALLTASWSGGSASRTTAPNGRAFIGVPANADVEIALQHAVYVRNFPFTVRDATDREVSMTAYEKGSVAVTVEDAEGPVSDASVVLRRAGREVVSQDTDDAGLVESGTIESGEYTAVVSKSGYHTAEEEIDVGADTETTIRVRRGTVTLRVNVTDDHFEPPRAVGQATVNVVGSGSVTTQPTGIGSISVPVNDWASIEVTKEGYERAEETVFVEEGDRTVSLTIQREPGVSIDLLNERVVIGERASLTVTDEYGVPVEDAAVLVDGEEVTRTDANGQAVVRIETEGTHQVVVRQGSLEASDQLIGVQEGAESTTTDSDDSDGTTEAETGLPGFGVGVALLGLLVAVLLVRARR